MCSSLQSHKTSLEDTTLAMRVLLTDLHSTLAQTVAKHLQDADHEVLGTVPSKTHVAPAKRRLLSHPSSDRADAVKDPVAVHNDKLALAKLLEKADVVVASGLARDPRPAMELLKLFEKAIAAPRSDADEQDQAATVKRFVAVSSVLAWSKNAVYANAKEQRGHSEDDFKTRKPARKFAELKTAETQILSVHRADVLETCVVAAGLVYGGAQSDLTPLFRNAWMHPDRPLVVPSLPGGGAQHGENLVPMVGVYDLGVLVAKLAVAPAVPKNYIVATDKPSQATTLRDLCVGLSVLLGNGKIHDQLTDEEVDELLVCDEDGDGDGGALAALQLHLCFDALSETSAMAALVPEDEFKHATTGLLSNLAFYVDDFVRSMDLRPLKTVVLGPPRVGKTVLSQRLAKEYYIPWLTLESIAEEILATTPVEAETNAAGEAKPEDEGTPSSSSPMNDEEDDPALRQLRAELHAWKTTGSSEGSVASVDDLPEATVVALLRWRLAVPQCRYQGYVLDGIPTSAALAAKIFEVPESSNGEGDDAEAKSEPGNDAGDAAGGEEEENADAKNTEGGTMAKSRSKQILDRLRPTRHVEFPNRVVLLHAPLDLLEERAQTLSEEQAIASGNTQSAFHARYTQFMSEAEPLATFFESRRNAVTDASGVEVLELHGKGDASDAERHDAIKVYMEQNGGKPLNFHPTRDELKAMEREHIRRQQEELERRKQQDADEEERDQAIQHARMEADHARLELIQHEEAELLEARAKPLRTYLMDTVLPALTEGMLEVVKVQPEDPIDYLAEYLFKKGRELEEAGQ